MNNREQIIREVANYLRPYDPKAADLALECISSINSRMAEQQRSFDKVGSMPIKQENTFDLMRSIIDKFLNESKPIYTSAELVIINDSIDRHINGNSQPKQDDWYPGKDYQRLFDRLYTVCSIPLESEMQEIIRIIHEDFPVQSPPVNTGDGWVKVEDGLPNSEQLVIVYTSDKLVLTGRYYKPDWYLYFQSGISRIENTERKVIAWQSLPIPPVQ